MLDKIEAKSSSKRRFSLVHLTILLCRPAVIRSTHLVAGERLRVPHGEVE